MSFQWKIGNKEMKNPSTYKISLEDLDNDSYRSKVTGALIDTVVAKRMHKISLSFDHLTEEEAEEIMIAINPNPITVTMKSPYFTNGTITAQFRVSKIDLEMFKDDEETEWADLNFSLVQKKKVSGQ